MEAAPCLAGYNGQLVPVAIRFSPFTGELAQCKNKVAAEKDHIACDQARVGEGGGGNVHRVLIVFGELHQRILRLSLRSEKRSQETNTRVNSR